MSKNKKRFAAAIMAQKNFNGGVTVNDTVLAFYADSEEEAIGVAMKHSKEKVYKPSDGWYGHQASVVEFSDDK